MVIPYIKVRNQLILSRVVDVTESERLGIDFDSAEYSYPVTAADEAETPEQAEEMEAKYG